MNVRRLWVYTTLMMAVVAASRHVAAQHLQAPKAAQPAEAMSAEDRVLAALDTKGDMQFNRATLEDVANWVRKQHGIKVAIDEKGLADAGIDPDLKLSHSLRQVSLGAALVHLLRPEDIVFTVGGDTLLLTAGGCPETPQRKEYCVRDLITGRNAAGKELRDGEPLIAFVTSVCVPSTWDTVGGSGAIDVVGDMLVVDQTWWAHREVKEQLASLRRVLKRQAAGDYRPADTTISSREAHVYEALNRRIDLAVDKMPLPKFAKLIAEITGVNVLVDQRQMTDEGMIAAETEISGEVRKMTLRNALGKLFREQDLRFDVRSEVIVFRAMDSGCQWPTCSIYPVADLLPAGPDQAAQSKKLGEYIRASIHPATWEEVGGDGRFRHEPFWDVLLIDQRPYERKAIEDLLGQMRKSQAAKPAAPAKAKRK